MIKFSKILFSFLVFIFLSSNSNAALVNIDPGIVGSTFNDISIGFDDINGHGVIAGNSIVPLEFSFTDSKNITVQTNSDAFFTAELHITYSIAAGSGFFPATSGSLRDADGNIVLNSWSTLNGTVGGGNSAGYTIGWADFITPQIDGTTFSGIYFNSIGFPSSGDRGEITSALLRLRFNGSSGQALVGLNPVPAPSSLLLLGIGILGLVRLGREK